MANLKRAFLDSYFYNYVVRDQIHTQEQLLLVDRFKE